MTLKSIPAGQIDDNRRIVCMILFCTCGTVDECGRCLSTNTVALVDVAKYMVRWLDPVDDRVVQFDAADMVFVAGAVAV